MTTMLKLPNFNKDQAKIKEYLNSVTEQEADEMLLKCEEQIANGRAIRRYGRLDLVRFHRLAQRLEGMKTINLLKLYDILYPQKSARERLRNIINFLEEEE